jgi:predicted transcriptional regulator of viral defense system
LHEKRRTIFSVAVVQHLTATYHLLDPGLSAAGRRLSRWRLRLNVDPDELDAVRGT